MGGGGVDTTLFARLVIKKRIRNTSGVGSKKSYVLLACFNRVNNTIGMLNNAKELNKLYTVRVYLYK